MTPLLLGLAVAGPSCRYASQRAPEPMPLRDPPQGWARAEPGTLETIVVRHADPVAVQRPGSDGRVPLAFYHKRERCLAGGRVFVGAGGRGEVIWPGDASSVILLGYGAIEIGEPTRDEPLVRFLEVTDARVFLTPEDQVALPGGALMRGDPLVPSGPFVLHRIDPEIVRLTNQAKAPARIRFLDAALDLAAGETIDIPVPTAGSSPLEVVETTSTPVGPFEVVSEAGVAVEAEGGVARARAREDGAVEALGVRVSLPPGGNVRLTPWPGRPPRQATPAGSGERP